MERLVIDGGKKLKGEITVQGAKNSVLPVIAATLAADGVSVIHNCPMLCDVTAELDILRLLGCEVEISGSCVRIDSTKATRCEIPENLMREMRSSIIFLGSLIARFGCARVSVPGGCDIGERPIDYHLALLEKMGVRTVCGCDGCLRCECPDGLHAARITLPYPSVGATENAILAAVKAKGTTVIENAAREPEIADLADFLIKCGARIDGAGERTIIIEGVKRLEACEYSVIPDRIIAATFMSAAAVTGGKITLRKVCPEHLAPVLPCFEASGCAIKSYSDCVTVSAPKRLKSMGVIRTNPYPGFPTDCQAVVMAMACVADGVTVITERIFENRFRHVAPLRRFGAQIETENNAVAIIEGKESLNAAKACSTDLRGGTALVIAALAARGRSEITGLHHIDRGCERIENCFSGLGGQIKRLD
ncbi:MAG: UDP-N-acetylglucosamine 1-carboxyvinyltransferase [Clostridia bacterium]|nr:UDP-N-acetylglucosamine 1-carboxyvinyltransferase [Clostridia bacterium]